MSNYRINRMYSVIGTINSTTPLVNEAIELIKDLQKNLTQNVIVDNKSYDEENLNNIINILQDYAGNNSTIKRAANNEITKIIKEQKEENEEKENNENKE